MGAVRLITAVSRDHVIGRRGTLPWRLPRDLAHFAEMTAGGTLVLGARSATEDSRCSGVGSRHLAACQSPDSVAHQVV